MSELLSPFITKETECPACNQSYPQRYFRSRLFLPGERESDRHVIHWKWLAENTAPAHPPFYHVYLCPHCFYADTTEDFANDPGREVLRNLARASDEQKTLIQLLGTHVDYENLDFESALNLHYLAMYIQTLAPADQLSHRKIASLLLRIAWLFREQSPEAKVAGESKKSEAVDEAFDKFEAALQKATGEWTRLTHALLERTSEVDKELGDPAQNPYRCHQSNLTKLSEAMFGEFYRLKTTHKHDLEGALLSGNGQAGKTFFEFPSHEAFMVRVKTAWPMAPTDETEALRAAIESFKMAVSTDPAYDSTDAHMKAVALIIDLMVRCDDLDSAFDMVRSIYRSAAEARQKYQMELRHPDTDPVKKRRIGNLIRRVNASLQQAADLRHKLMDMLIERDKERILRIIQAHGGASLREVEVALESEGIPPSLIARLKERGDMLKPPSQRRRKLF